MTKYSYGRPGGLHTDTNPDFDWGLPNDLFGGRADLLHLSTQRTHHIALRAKNMPNVGSVEARAMHGQKWKNRLFGRIRKQAERRAGGEDVVNVLGHAWDKVMNQMNHIYRLQQRADTLEFLSNLNIDIISDAADYALGIVREALGAIADVLFQQYCETMYRSWSAHEMEMNNGQVTLTEMYFFPEIAQFLGEQLILGSDGSPAWPFWTDTWEYVARIEGRYEQEVWERAFSDTTMDPVPVCEEIRNAAVIAKIAAGG